MRCQVVEKTVVKKIDNLGRFTIPKFFRDMIDIDFGEEVEIFMVDEKTIGLRKIGPDEY